STTLTNNGTVVWVAGHVTGSDGARIYNAGLWQIVTTTGYQFINGAGTNTFINASSGTLQKTTGSPTIINWDFNTTGTVHAPSGTLSPNWVGTNVLQGTMNVAGGAMNGTLTMTNNATMGWSAGSINGPLTVMTDAVLNWSGGSLNGGMTVAAGGLLTISNSVT